jgi:hypothetical protein
VSSVREKIEGAATDHMDNVGSMDPRGSFADFKKGAEFGYRLAIEELRERAKSLDVLGASVLARDVAREADYLAARLEGELEKPKMRMKCGHCGGDHTWIDCPEAS